MSQKSGAVGDRVRKWRRWAALAGATLALVCGSLPPDYRQVCEALAEVCRLGM